jgi:hypothetical protein
VFDVKVLDFGIAKLAADVHTAATVGTPLYMAPEQTEVQTPPTPAIDVWAFGLIVYRMLTGRFFWRAARERPPSMTVLLREIVLDPIPPASMRAAEEGIAGVLPNGFDAWLARCLEREPAARFQGVGEAYNAVRDLLRVDVSAITTPLSGIERPAPTPVPSPSRPITSTPAPPITGSGRPPPSSKTPPSSPPSSEVRLIAEHPDVRVGRGPGLLIIRWSATPTGPTVALVDEALGRAIGARRGRSFGIVPVINAHSGQPLKETREDIARMMLKYDGSIYGAAYVVTGSGFQAATVRGAITALMLLARPKHPTKVFARVAEALAWLAVARNAPPNERVIDEQLIIAIESFCI